MASMITSGHYDVVLASRILGVAQGACRSKYISNRLLTLFENLMLGIKLSEYHTGYRAFSRPVLETLPLEENSDDFVFDNEMIAQAAYFGFHLGDISCPTKYFEEASSISFARSVKYGFGVLLTSVKYVFQKTGMLSSPLFNTGGRKLK
jgi:hypothetical protein